MASLPDSVDVVVIGTGVIEALVAWHAPLPQCIHRLLGTAAAFHGRKVLVLDDQQYYGGAGATLSLTGFWNWYAQHAAQGEGDDENGPEDVASPAPTSADTRAAERRAGGAHAPGGDGRDEEASAGAAALGGGAGRGGADAAGHAQEGAGSHSVPEPPAASVQGISGPSEERIGADPGAPSSLTHEGTADTSTMPLRRTRQDISHLQAHVQASKVPGRDSDYCIDLAHQALECTGPCIEAIRGAGLHLYVDFMPVADAFVYHAGGQRLMPVPGSIAAVHGTQSLSMEDRRRLWLFMRQVERAATGVPTSLFEGQRFLADLQHCGLPEFVQDAVLYAVIRCQDPVDEQTELPGQQALAAIGRYISQTGTYVDNQAPYIEACYGSSEIAQAAIRACCVHGGVAALDCGLDALLLSGNSVSGVRMRDGHVVRCSHVVVTQPLLSGAAAPAVTSAGGGAAAAQDVSVPRQRQHSGGEADDRTHSDVSAAERTKALHADPSSTQGGEGAAATTQHQQQTQPPGVDQPQRCDEAVARGIVLLSGSLLDGVANACITIPPGASSNPHTVTVWQCHSSLHVCPDQHSLLYLSTKVEEGVAAADVLKPCVLALLRAAGIASGHDSTAQASSGGPLQQRGSADKDQLAAALGDNAAPAAQAPPVGQSADSRAAPASPQTQQHSASSAGPAGLEACVECYYVQHARTGNAQRLPACVHSASAPTAATTLDAAVSEAEGVFARLCPGLAFLSKPNRPEQQGGADQGEQIAAESADGDAEEHDALEAALLALGVQ